MGLFDSIQLLRPSGATTAALAAAMAACIAVSPAAAQTPAATQTNIKFSLDGKFEGPSAMFLLPFDRGYFTAQKLAVTFEEAPTPLDPISRVASGSHEMGFADINAIIRYRDQHPTTPLKVVFMVYNKPPYAIVARKSKGITEPKQLEGKRLGAPPTGTTTGEWPLFAKLNGIDVSKVTIETVAVPVRAPMIAAGQLDAALGFSFRLYVDVKDRGVDLKDVVLMPMANYGLKLYGNAIIVNSKFAAEKPEAVKAFLQAFLRGLKEVVRRPGDAVVSILKRDDLAKREVELERLRMAIGDNILTPEVKANGYGDVVPARLDEAIGQIAQVYTFKTKPKAEDVFDASFLPPPGERKAH
jgi:NitT/TauT family transport system substrate-binding protein